MNHICWTPKLEADIRSAAIDAGFHLAGLADAEFPREETRFESWIDAGRAGEMEYLKRRDASGALLRSRLRVAIPWARSVFVCALNYDSSEPLSSHPAPPGTGWIGRYAVSGKRPRPSDPEGPSPLAPADYHEELLTRLRAVETRLLEAAPCQTRCYVDTGPIVERNFAAYAGVGWIGKNTCVINQQLGSWLLLGIIVTSLPLVEDAATHVAAQLLVPDRCGSCTRCIDACPTDALVAPREMDASRCIAYLTIEKKGTIDPELRAGIGRQIFGCDICQDVCPWNSKSRNSKSRNSTSRNSNSQNSNSQNSRNWNSKHSNSMHSNASQREGNRTPPIAVPSAMEPRPELVNPSLAWLAEMDSTAFKRWFKGSPLERTGRKRLHRNVAIAMGNSGEAQFLPRLRQWAEGADEVLAETARWAIDRIHSASIES